MKRGQAVEGVAGSEAERSEAQEPADVRRGRPGRRSAEDRRQAVLELLSGKATVDQLAFRFGVEPETIESWRAIAVDGIGDAMRHGTGKSARERELEKKLRSLERAFTDLAIRNELAERALSERPTRPGKSPRCAARPLGGRPRCQQLCRIGVPTLPSPGISIAGSFTCSRRPPSNRIHGTLCGTKERLCFDPICACGKLTHRRTGFPKWIQGS